MSICERAEATVTLKLKLSNKLIGLVLCFCLPVPEIYCRVVPTLIPATVAC